MNVVTPLAIAALALGIAAADAPYVNALDYEPIGQHAVHDGAALAADVKLVDVSLTKAQKKEIKAEFAKFPSFEKPYVPRKMAAGDRYVRAAAGGDGVTLTFEHMRLYVSPRNYEDAAQGTAVTLPNGAAAKWYSANQETSADERLVFQVDDRFVTISSPDRTLNRTVLESIAATVAKL